MLPKRVTRAWLPFTMGAATAIIAVMLVSLVRLAPSPPTPLDEKGPVEQPAVEASPSPPAATALSPQAARVSDPASEAARAVLPAGGSAQLGGEPPDAAPRTADEPASPAGEVIVVVTATAPLPTMAPVQVTPTAVLSEAEQEARTRRAVEAMQQSTENTLAAPAEMPPPQP